MNLEILELIFWAALGAIGYIYVGYPLLLAVLARPRAAHAIRDGEDPAHVTILISAYNESGIIGEKIRNTLALDYPRGFLSIIVVSDCSSDGTDEIVLRHASQGVQLVRSAERVGKAAALNLGIQHASGDVLIFSDANAMYRPDSIRFLTRHFSDSGVGYVVGNARYVEGSSQTASAESEGLYWKLETWLKKKESDFGSVVGGDGAIYAIRRELYTPLRPTDINDFLNPLQIIVRGYRGVYEPSAVCFEEAGDTFEKEFQRKVRIVSRSLNAVRRVPRILLPWTQPRHWLALISHKILRWFAPFFLLLALMSSLALWPSPLYRIAACLQLAFYLLAAMGWMAKSRGRAPRLFYLPYYFSLVNVAAVLGIFKCFSGSLTSTWQTVRQDTPARSDESIQFVNRRP
jgi:cellulose synthase/poly-beta-1,6-N-acetylglucosamine synthase-like glycosyltransferase